MIDAVRPCSADALRVPPRVFKKRVFRKEYFLVYVPSYHIIRIALQSNCVSFLFQSQTYADHRSTSELISFMLL